MIECEMSTSEAAQTSSLRCLTIDFKALMSEDGCHSTGCEACENVVGCTTGTTTGRGRAAGARVPRLFLKTGFQQRTREMIVNVPISQILEEIVEVLQLTLRKPRLQVAKIIQVQSLTVEQIVNMQTLRKSNFGSRNNRWERGTRRSRCGTQRTSLSV